jgi:hypothetical protein
LADAVEDVELGMLSVALHEVGVHLCQLKAALSLLRRGRSGMDFGEEVGLVTVLSRLFC